MERYIVISSPKVPEICRYRLESELDAFTDKARPHPQDVGKLDDIFLSRDGWYSCSSESLLLMTISIRSILTLTQSTVCAFVT
jgi:hypothetical protein